MSDSALSSEQRAFHCPQCKGRIVIPINLPATTGPCPHCQTTITSPAPGTEPAAQEELIPIIKPRPSKLPVAPPLDISPPSSEKYPEPTPIPTPTPTKQEKPTKSGKLAPILLIVVFALIGLGGGAYFFKDMLMPAADPIPLKPIPQPTKSTINPTLQKYLAAPSLEEKLTHVFNAEELQPKMEAFYKDGVMNESDIPANAFSMVSLPASDSKKGFILLSYNQPAAKNLNNSQPNSEGNQNTKILAFLKETENGVKLDWEIFAQTKYRTFNNFIKTPVIGKSEVFRLIVSSDKTSAPDGKSYLLADPAHHSDTTKVTADPASQAAQALSVLNTAGTERTATIELTWLGDATNPKLEIKQFICWEFLGLGGKEIAETPPSN